MGRLIFAVTLVAAAALAEEAKPRGQTSYMPVDPKEPFSAVMSRMKAAKPQVMKRHSDGRSPHRTAEPRRDLF